VMQVTVERVFDRHDARVMTTFRLISLSAHSAAEMLLGFAVMVSPFLFGLGTAAMLISVVMGALIVGVAFSTLDEESSSIAAHHANDIGLSLGLAAASLATGIAGDGRAALILGLAAALDATLLLTTRYSRAR
jgi:hypothetical protein